MSAAEDEEEGEAKLLRDIRSDAVFDTPNSPMMPQKIVCFLDDDSDVETSDDEEDQ